MQGECIVLYTCLSTVRCEMKTQACLPSIGEQPSLILPESYTSIHMIDRFLPSRTAASVYRTAFRTAFLILDHPYKGPPYLLSEVLDI
jgi:hypothetical protein